MNNINKLSKAIATTLGTVALLGSLPASAETTSLDASVTVLNTFTLAQTQAISFGTIRAKASTEADNTAFVVLASATGGASTTGTDVGAANSDVPAVTSLVAGTQGIYDVSGAAAFTPLNLTVSANTVDLVLGSAPPTKPNAFRLSEITANDNNGTEVTLTDAPAQQLTTDVNGAINFTVGGKLSTQDIADRPAMTDGNYTDGSYTGSLTLTVEY